MEIEASSFPARKIGIEMVRVNGGSFLLGNAVQCQLSDFEMGKYPITQGQWEYVMGNNPSRFVGRNLPVEQVSWEDCQKFLKELNQKLGLKGQEAYRLPTEAEWEYAARGGKYARKTEYAGSDQLKEVGWYGYRDNAHIESQIPGLRIPNELGIYDLSGNVWEWCQDWYGSYSITPMKDPLGPAYGSRRVLRGGSWINGAGRCRVANRRRNLPDGRFGNYGLRLARTVL